jgi:hypothetical protein
MLAANGDKDAAESNNGGGIKTYIEVGETNDTEIEILSGLREGDRVLVQSSPQVESGQSGRGRRR